MARPKNTKVKLDLLTGISTLLMVEKCHTMYRYTKANNKYMKDYDKNKESSYLKYQDINDLYGWAISQKLLVNDFRWAEETSEFNENFIKKL